MEEDSLLEFIAISRVGDAAAGPPPGVGDEDGAHNVEGVVGADVVDPDVGDVLALVGVGAAEPKRMYRHRSWELTAHARAKKEAKRLGQLADKSESALAQSNIHDKIFRETRGLPVNNKPGGSKVRLNDEQRAACRFQLACRTRVCGDEGQRNRQAKCVAFGANIVGRLQAQFMAQCLGAVSASELAEQSTPRANQSATRDAQAHLSTVHHIAFYCAQFDESGQRLRRWMDNHKKTGSHEGAVVQVMMQNASFHDIRALSNGSTVKTHDPLVVLKKPCVWRGNVLMTSWRVFFVVAHSLC